MEPVRVEELVYIWSDLVLKIVDGVRGTLIPAQPIPPFVR